MKLMNNIDKEEKKLIRKMFWRSGAMYASVNPVTMAGAGIMSSISALKSGAGLVTLAVPSDNYDIVAIKAPLEIMVKKLEDVDNLLIKKDTQSIMSL